MHRASETGDNSNDALDVERILTDLEAGDLLLEDPPPDVWIGIAAGAAEDQVAAGSGPRSAPRIVENPPAAIEYEIDADDVVVATDAAWADAAHAAGSPELEAVNGDKTLWDAIGDAETRDLWRLVVAQVRTTGSSMTVPLRCDGPDARRWFELTVTAAGGGHVRFRCALQFEDPRPRLSLLDPSAKSSGELEPVKVCGWCGRGTNGDGWLELEDLLRASRALEADVVPPLAYGVCGDCRDDLALTLQPQSENAAPR